MDPQIRNAFIHHHILSLHQGIVIQKDITCLGRTKMAWFKGIIDALAYFIFYLCKSTAYTVVFR